MSNPRDALEFLGREHERIQALFVRIHATPDTGERRRIVRLLKYEQDLHTELEETLFYPALSQSDAFRDILEDCLEEHQEIRLLLADAIADEDDDDFETDLEDLQAAIQHHFLEEQTELFKMAREFFTQEELVTLGQSLDEGRSRLLGAQEAA